MAKLLAHLDALIREAEQQVVLSRKEGGTMHMADVRLLHGLQELRQAYAVTHEAAAEE